MKTQNELLADVVRNTQLGASIAGELAQRAQENGDAGLPLGAVRESLRYLREHLTTANASTMALEDIAKGCEPPRKEESHA